MPTPRDEQHARTMIEGVNSTGRLLGLNQPDYTMPTYNGTPVLTIGKAEQCRRAVEEWFIDHMGWAEDRPTLYKPGHEGDMWVLSLEGCDDWAIRLSADESVKWPDGVWVEPVADWCLGLYPVT